MEEKKRRDALPEAFIRRMEELLGPESREFFDACDMPPVLSLRLNPLKGKMVDITTIFPKASSVVPWEELGRYYPETDRPGSHPLHEAGAWYVQEACAMAPAALLMSAPVGEDERILDLCAAPGGKSTQIAARMSGKGLLISNEIVPGRAKILSGNMERMGVRNALVTNHSPSELAQRFAGFFSRILVDAPCSGEGMFRKHPETAEEWSEENVDMCARRQDEILDMAARMLMSGGVMVYSTCTFEAAENEGAIERFLARNPEFSLVKTGADMFLGRGEKGGSEGRIEVDINQTLDDGVVDIKQESADGLSGGGSECSDAKLSQGTSTDRVNDLTNIPESMGKSVDISQKSCENKLKNRPEIEVDINNSHGVSSLNEACDNSVSTIDIKSADTASAVSASAGEDEQKNSNITGNYHDLNRGVFQVDINENCETIFPDIEKKHTVNTGDINSQSKPGIHRLWPHRVRGEGHFAAVLKKEGVLPAQTDSVLYGGRSIKTADRTSLKLWNEFLEENFCSDYVNQIKALIPERSIAFFGTNLYSVPELCPDIRGLKVLRCGLMLGTVIRDRFEPSHALAMAAEEDWAVRAVRVDERGAGDYLKGLTLQTDREMKGWCLVCYEGFVLGWGKAVSGTVKNHYPKGLRR